MSDVIDFPRLYMSTDSPWVQAYNKSHQQALPRISLEASEDGQLVYEFFELSKGGRSETLAGDIYLTFKRAGLFSLKRHLGMEPPTVTISYVQRLNAYASPRVGTAAVLAAWGMAAETGCAAFVDSFTEKGRRLADHLVDSGIATLITELSPADGRSDIWDGYVVPTPVDELVAVTAFSRAGLHR